MIKSQLIEHIATKITFLSEKQVSDAINQILTTMTECLADGNRIEIRGFGSFSVNYRGPRSAHNPKTGEPVETEGKHTPHFKPGKELRERVTDSKARISKILED